MTIPQIISRLTELIEPVLSAKHNTSPSFPVEFTAIHVLERVTYNLKSLQILLADGLAKNNHVIGLLSRNLITDYITIFYIAKFSNCQEEIEHNLFRMYNSDLSKVMEFMKIMKEAGYCTQEQKAAFENRLTQENNLWFIIQEKVKELAERKFPSTSSLVKKIAQLPKEDLWAQQIVGIYDIWTFYSKFEHIGLNSYYLTRNINIDIIKLRLKQVLVNSILLTATCLHWIGDKPSSNKAIELLKECSASSHMNL